MAFRKVTTETHELQVREPRYPALLTCDHASNHIPEWLDGLGLEAGLSETHIGWDIGAGQLARMLGEALHIPVVLAATSRLVVDCNRRLGHAGAFPETSGGIAVPGNRHLTAADREARADRYYWPYHHAIRDQLRALEEYAPAPAVIAIHSFTPRLSQHERPWHAGILWDKDARIAEPLLRALRKIPEIEVGDNEPYSGRDPEDFTLDHHAEAEGLPHVGIEIRQDQIADAAGCAVWAERLAGALAPVLADERLYRHRAGTVLHAEETDQ